MKKKTQLNYLTRINLLNLLIDFYNENDLNDVKEANNNYISMSFYSHSFTEEKYRKYYYINLYLENKNCSLGTLIFTVLFYNNSVSSGILYDVLVLENIDIENWVLHQKLSK